jgi:hypothetical protein
VDDHMDRLPVDFSTLPWIIPNPAPLACCPDALPDQRGPRLGVSAYMQRAARDQAARADALAFASGSRKVALR